MRQKLFGLTVAVACGIVGAMLVAGTVAGAASAPVTTPATGGLPLCQANLNTCNGNLSQAQTDLNTCTADLAACQAQTGGGVLKTGQTTCYDSAGNVIACAGTGQDGELQKGAARSYTDNGDGTITDNATGLMWEKLCDGAGCPVINDWDTTYTWAQAFQKIADLNTANFAGHNDWRLPNINEFQTLTDYGRFLPAIDPAFNNGVDSFTQSSFYWSSTTFALETSVAWLVDFINGGVDAFLATDFGFFVRAVRGGS